MVTTSRKPVSVGGMLRTQFLEPLHLTQVALAGAMDVQRKHINERRGDRRAITADTPLMLARVFGSSGDFWLNLQRRNDLWEAMNSPDRGARRRVLSLKITPVGA